MLEVRSSASDLKVLSPTPQEQQEALQFLGRVGAEGQTTSEGCAQGNDLGVKHFGPSRRGNYCSIRGPKDAAR